MKEDLLGRRIDRCKHHNRFMRLLDNGNMDGSHHCGKDELPSGWTWERFAVVVGAAAPLLPYHRTPLLQARTAQHEWRWNIRAGTVPFGQSRDAESMYVQ